MTKRILCLAIAILSWPIFANTFIQEQGYRSFSVKDLPKSLQKASAASLKNFHPERLSLRHKAASAKLDKKKYEKTERPLDVALLDDGYIVTRTPGPLKTYAVTRFGNMRINEQGKLMIFDLNVQGRFCEFTEDEYLYNCDITIPAPILPPTATSLVKMQVNLKEGYETSPPFSISFVVINSMGGWNSLKAAFIPLSTGKKRVVITDFNEAILADGELHFNRKGILTEQIGLEEITVDSADAEPLVFSLDFSGSTSFPLIDSQVIHFSHDGYIAGELLGFSIANDGGLSAYYSNGIEVDFAQIHATTEYPEDLTPYLPLYPNNIWTFKEHPQRQRNVAVGIRFLSGWLEGEARRLPNT